MESNKKRHKETYSQDRNSLSDFKTRLMVMQEEMLGGGMHWEAGIGMYTQLYTKSIGNRDLLYSLGKSIQCSVMAYMGKESEKEWIYMYMYMYG